MKNIRIQIPTPCQEKWSSFTTTAKGGFCSSCQKEVIDFTKWTEDELKLYFKTRPTNACGRFRQDQLKVYTYNTTRKKPITWVSVLFGSFLLLFSSRQATGQVSEKLSTPIEQYEPFVNGEVPAQVLSKTIRITGIVRSSEDGQVMPGVNVLQSGTVNGTTTNAEGQFFIELKDSISNPLLLFSFIGFKSIEHLVDITKQHQEISMQMLSEDIQLGGLVVGAISYRRFSPRRIWWKIKNIFS
ncbi:carboxypeptidase-like regulatory domain-containing protein [Chryseolinea sp. H1M3-3]|uniref:carboxypeptidase-like regulatory domain-containing protein n=1 Tax=Chryseolinea sp. H1M3-3 TaxID=3034144 RepID=UPI0023EA972A|nr:carboxypeptidase-like regulatory domain-containing protein [Chryseolinea sp. H1M3-3]